MAVSKEIVAVVGPNGSGKSSVIFAVGIDRTLTFINPDDIARTDFFQVKDEEERNRLAWKKCNEQRDALIEAGVPFGFETVGSHPSKVELLQKAKELGYSVILLFVSTEDPEINIKRIQYRVSLGGHDVPDDKVRSRFYRTLELLPDYLKVADIASVWDNSLEGDRGTIRELVRKNIDGKVIHLPDAKNVKWIQKHLLKK